MDRIAKHREAPSERADEPRSDHRHAGAERREHTAETGPAITDRDAFLARLRGVATSTATDMLGERAHGCPYIDAWFERHATTDVETLERLARRYGGASGATSADELLASISRRLRMGVAYWSAGDDVAGELELAGFHASARAVAGHGVLDDETEALHVAAELDGRGTALGATAASQLAGALGEPVGDVRVHTDARAAALADAHDARAFAVGNHVVFGPGEFRPGTVIGDVLLAHELAHVIQQRDGDAAASSAHEADATRAATSAVGKAYGITTAAHGPALRSGLSLQRCTKKGPKVSDPNAIIPVAKLIEYVEEAERQHPDDKPDEIVTRIRMQYYNGPRFKQLIPNAHAYDLVQRMDPMGQMPTVWMPWPRDLTYLRGDAEALRAHGDENAIGDNPSPYLAAGGSNIDFGHVVLGLDALLHPGTGAPFTTYDVPSIDPAGVVADIGLASVWTSNHEKKGSPGAGCPSVLSSPSLDGYYALSAPEADLLGDVDAIAAHVTLQGSPDLKLSQLLRLYYLGDGGKPAASRTRWQSFCAGAGLAYTRTGTTITWDPKSRAALITRTNRFSSLAEAGGYNSALDTLTSDPVQREWPYTERVVDKFLGWVKTNLEAELASGTKP